MADLPYIQTAQEVKITGQDNTGNTVNYVGADANGNMNTKDYADGATGSAVPSVTMQVGGSDGTNLRTFKTDTSGRLNILLNDSAGTAITLGQSVMASSLSVTLASNQTGINSFLDKSGTGTISALNGAVTVTTNGMSTISFSAQGTFVATLQVQGQAGDAAWVGVIGYVPGAGNTSTVLTGPSMLVFPIGGFNQVRLIAIAYTSGTANIQYNLGSGVQGTQVFNLFPASLTGTMNIRDGSSNAITSTTTNSKQRLDVGLSSEGTDGAAVPFSTVQIGGRDGSGNLQAVLTDTSGNQAVLLKDSAANGSTSTAVSGTAANKQPLDVTPIHGGTSRYFTTFATQQTAATAANASIFSMRNAAASTKTVYIERVTARMGFNATNPVTRTQQQYVMQRFSAATPTGGTALTAAQGDSADAASQVTDIRFLDTGLTTTSVTFVANNFAIMAGDSTQGLDTTRVLLDPPSVIKLAPGEGLVIRLGVAAVAGTSVSFNIEWREQ